MTEAFLANTLILHFLRTSEKKSCFLLLFPGGYNGNIGHKRVR